MRKLIARKVVLLVAAVKRGINTAKVLSVRPRPQENGFNIVFKDTTFLHEIVEGWCLLF